MNKTDGDVPLNNNIKESANNHAIVIQSSDIIALVDDDCKNEIDSQKESELKNENDTIRECINNKTVTENLDEDVTFESRRKGKKQKQKKSTFVQYFRWPLIVLCIVLVVSFSFGVVSEIALSNASLAIAIIVILVFLVISILTDIVGVAITAVDIKPFRSMSAKKVSGAKEAVVLIKNAGKVASIFADIMGDVCGVLSGSAGAVITAIYLQNVTTELEAVLIASLVSAIIAGAIIASKAFCKGWAIKNCNQVILVLGKIIKVLTFNKIGNKKSKKNKK